MYTINTQVTVTISPFDSATINDDNFKSSNYITYYEAMESVAYTIKELKKSEEQYIIEAECFIGGAYMIRLRGTKSIATIICNKY